MARKLAVTPKAVDLALLSDASVKVVMDTAAQINAQEARYGIYTMCLAAACFMVCIASFTFLVMNDHATAAGIILGTTVMGVVGQMINARI